MRRFSLLDDGFSMERLDSRLSLTTLAVGVSVAPVVGAQLSAADDPLPAPEPDPGANPGTSTPTVNPPMPPSGPIGPGTS